MSRTVRHVCIVLAGAALLEPASALAQVRDVEMKAAYIYNFAQFTTWTEQRARQPFRVCADAGSAIWPSLEAYNGKPVNGRGWSTVDAAVPSDRAPCDLLILARSAGSANAAPGMLVVRDGAGRGPAMITLVDDDERLRFDVDTREAEKSGLRFSSKLLRLARTVL